MAVMIATAIIYGCGNDMLEPPAVDGMVPVEVNNVLSVNADITESRDASPVTGNGAKMGVFRIGDSKYTPQDNLEYTYSSTKNTWTSTTPILVGAQATTLCAYYPYNSVTFTTGTTATLEAGKYEAEKDMSYATSAGSTVTNQNPEATFAMKHAYARIKLAIKRSDSYIIGNCNITTVNLKNNTNFFVNKTLDISTGSYTGSAITGGWTYTLNTGDMAAGSTNNAYDVLVPQQTVSSGLTITLDVDGVKRSATIPAASFNSNLTAGLQYSISLLLLPDTEVIPNGNVTITDWVTDSSTIQGAVEVSGITIKVPASDINLGGSGCTESDKTNLSVLTWAGGNLISSYNLNPYIWAPSQDDYGYYYTWNSTFTGNASTNNTDPCTKLDVKKYGTGWRTPSEFEIAMLSRCTDKVVVDGGMWFMNNPKGLYLRLGGYRGQMQGSGRVANYSAGSEGEYWSSSKYSDISGIKLSITDGLVTTMTSHKNYGLLVRCVKG